MPACDKAGALTAKPTDSATTSIFLSARRIYTVPGAILGKRTKNVQLGRNYLPENVRFGSKADICGATEHVRFAPNSDRESGHQKYEIPTGKPLAQSKIERVS